MASTEVYPIKTKRDRDALKNALHGRDRLLFVLGVSLGLRISDLLTLKIGDLRGKERLSIKEGKTKKHRTIKLNKTIKKAVEGLEGADEDYIFRSQKGGHIKRETAYRALKNGAKRAGIMERVGPIGSHSLRKTHGLILYENGLDLPHIMRAFGHSSQDITARYIGLETEKIENAIEAIEL